MNEIEQQVRTMTRAERADYLRARGWRRISARSSQAWRAPDPNDHGTYTLAAAIRTELGARFPVVDK